MWQDLIFAAGNIVFIVALIPAVRHAEKPPRITSLLNAAVLLTFAVTFATLQLWYAMTTVLIIGILWIALAVQQHQKLHK